MRSRVRIIVYKNGHISVSVSAIMPRDAKFSVNIGNTSVIIYRGKELYKQEFEGKASIFDHEIPAIFDEQLIETLKNIKVGDKPDDGLMSKLYAAHDMVSEIVNDVMIMDNYSLEEFHLTRSIDYDSEEVDDFSMNVIYKECIYYDRLYRQLFIMPKTIIGKIHLDESIIYEYLAFVYERMGFIINRYLSQKTTKSSAK